MDLNLAISLLRDVRDYEPAAVLFWRLTDPLLLVDGEEPHLIATRRLRQHNPKYPLLGLELQMATEDCSSVFFEALAATTTLTGLVLSCEVTSDIAARIARELTALPCIRVVALEPFTTAAGSELLQSRRNWEYIDLSDQGEVMTSFASLNQTDFELRFKQGVSFAAVEPWLSNPHLTALTLLRPVYAESCFDALQRCKNLTALVRVSRFRECPLSFF